MTPVGAVMTRLIALVTVCLTTACGAARASNCEQETIKEWTHSGAYLVTASGQSFLVLGQGFIDPSNWQANEHIEVCEDAKKSKKTKSKIYQLKNTSRSETLVTVKVENQRRK